MARRSACGGNLDPPTRGQSAVVALLLRWNTNHLPDCLPVHQVSHGGVDDHGIDFFRNSNPAMFSFCESKVCKR